MRRSGSEGSFRHSISGGSAPASATAAASAASWAAMALRTHTAEILTCASASSSRSQRLGSAPASTARRATSAEVCTLDWSR